ncbi:MAG: hypothetical protein NVSMB47_07490 [Polyangiales bacterium]
MCVDAAGKENAVCCEPGQGCFAYLSQPRHCQRCEADTGGERCNQRCCATDLEKCTDFVNSTCCRNEAVCNLRPGSCGPDGDDCVHKGAPEGDACCPTDAACNDPPDCCKGGKVCIKHPADSGPQFCCPEALACGSRACCTDPRAPCARGFPSESGTERSEIHRLGKGAAGILCENSRGKDGTGFPVTS